jgi:hypothetical protein
VIAAGGLAVAVVAVVAAAGAAALVDVFVDVDGAVKPVVNVPVREVGAARVLLVVVGVKELKPPKDEPNVPPRVDPKVEPIVELPPNKLVPKLNVEAVVVVGADVVVVVAGAAVVVAEGAAVVVAAVAAVVVAVNKGLEPKVEPNVEPRVVEPNGFELVEPSGFGEPNDVLPSPEPSVDPPSEVVPKLNEGAAVAAGAAAATVVVDVGAVVLAGVVPPIVDRVFELRDEPRVPPNRFPVVALPPPRPVAPKVNVRVVVVGVEVAPDKALEPPSVDPKFEPNKEEPPVLCVLDPKFNAGVVVFVVTAGVVVDKGFEAPKVVPPRFDPVEPNRPPVAPPSVLVEPKFNVGAAPDAAGAPVAGVVVAGLFKLNENGDELPKFIIIVNL